MAARAKKKASNIFVWIILGLLMIGLAGFGIGSFGGSASAVGSVGTARISVQDYARALQNEINAQSAQSGQSVNLLQLQAAGIDRAVLEGLVARAALSHETDALGLSVGNAEIARQIRQNGAFQSLSGSFDRIEYERVLRFAGLSIADFEQDVRHDTARGILQAAIAGGIVAPEQFAEAVIAYQSETRNFSTVRVTEAALSAGRIAPTEAELRVYYEENPQRFTDPELRRITYAWVTPSQIMDEMQIDETALRELYDDRIDEFVQDERRLLERLVFGTFEEAEAARTAIEDGSTDFDTLVADRGLTLNDVDLGDLSRGDLNDAAAEMIFADDTSELIGPVESGLGPALFRVNAVLEASEVTFEEAREDLTAELSASAAIRAVDDARDDYEDLLAGGATLEELANESDMILGQIDWLPTSEDQIAAYEAFREIAAVATERDFPELFELSDGGLFALRLDEIVPPTVQPFDQARDIAEAGWQAEQLRDRVTARAFDLVAGLDSSSSLETLPLTVTQEQQIRRQDFVPDAPPTLVAQVFQQSEVGDVVVIPGADTAWIVRLDRINAAVRTNETTTLLLNIVQTQAAQSIAQDVFEAFGQALESDIGIRLDPAMINAVHATLP